MHNMHAFAYIVQGTCETIGGYHRNNAGTDRVEFMRNPSKYGLVYRNRGDKW